STDAVTGNQLHALGDNVAKSLGGSASYENGTWTAPTFTVKGFKEDGTTEDKEYHDVASAFAGVGSSFTDLHKEITNEIKNEITTAQGDALNWSETANAFVATHGSGEAKTNSKLTSLLDGAIKSGSTDAVTGNQLHALGDNVAKSLGGGAKYEEGQWTAPVFTVKSVNADGKTEDKNYHDVTTAFAGVGSSFANVNNSITNIKNEIGKDIADAKSDSLLWSETANAFVATHGKEGSKTNSKLTSLLDGAIQSGSTDAVTGNQLHALGDNVAKSLGGSASYENGTWTAPTFTVKSVKEDGNTEDKEYHDVTTAFAGVGSSFANVNNSITNIHNELKNEINKVVGDSLVKQDSETKVIKIGAETEGRTITIANSNGDTRSIFGVKAATLSEDSTEAVNGSQLYSLNKTLATYFGGGASYENGAWTAPTFKVTTFNESGNAEEHSYANIAEAFAGVSSSFTKLHNDITDNDNIKQNALLWSDEDSAFVALHEQGDKRSKSKLKLLLDGDISEGSSEAITGNQLYSLNKTLAMYLGGGARYEGGAWHAPEFKVARFNADGSLSDKKNYNDVAGAFEGVSESMTLINDRIKEVSSNIDTNSLHWNEDAGSYDASYKGVSSKITNVLGGKVEKGSQEVVNGGQLWETNEKVNEVDHKVDKLDQHVKDIETAVIDGAVNYDKDAEGKKSNSITLVGGNDSEPVLIDNVGDGKIETGSKEAVNGGQLHDYTEKQMKIVLDDAKKYTDDKVSSLVNDSLNESKSYTDMKFETLNYAIEDVRKEARQAAAIGLAVSNLRYYDIPGSLSVSFGSGLWRSQSAFAIGAGYTSEDGNIRSNVSITSAGGHWGIGAGITLRLR
ncbi:MULTISPECIES: Vomp family autotransporter, partial [unclassified Bartonella]|uniref:Vomp family autotransporter n=2 Tax=Bartonella TaxID=773 RepID=UPI0035D12EE7